MYKNFWQAPVAVGIAARSSEDMYMSAGFGKCVEILHVIGDKLYSMDKPLPRPQLGPVIFIEQDLMTTKQTEKIDTVDGDIACDEVSEISECVKNVEIIVKQENQSNLEPVEIGAGTSSSVKHSSCNEETEKVNNLVKEMDDLLEYCFLKACKISLKKEDLPMITSTFFKNNMINACPSGCTIDVKKSSYKKLSVFLATMKEKGVIDTFTVKGVESLLSVKVHI